jgi:hypothetical protein
LPVPKHIAGQSLTEPLAEDREVLSESFPGGRAWFTNAVRFDRTFRGSVSASQKYISTSTGSPELYNLLQDPAESNNLYNPEQAESRDAAERFRVASQMARAAGQSLRSPGKVDRDTVERLRSLGYVGK